MLHRPARDAINEAETWSELNDEATRSQSNAALSASYRSKNDRRPSLVHPLLVRNRNDRNA
jgi:hypothetical protein